MMYTDGSLERWEGYLSDRNAVAYRVGQIVMVRVERVRSSGAHVRFENGDQGYIRPREMTLSANADPRAILTVGQTIRAMVVQPSTPGLLPELSLRRLEPDPWPTFAARHEDKEGIVMQKVEGIVGEKAGTRPSPTRLYANRSPNSTCLILLLPRWTVTTAIMW